jgi:hypothetical protein
LHNPNEWLRFYKQWRRYKLATTAALITSLVIFFGVTYTAMAGAGIVDNPIAGLSAGDGATPSETGTPSASPVHTPQPTSTVLDQPVLTPLATIPADEFCGVVSPQDGDEVGGMLEVEGRCRLLPGATIFVLLKDVYRYATLGDAQQHWVQCETKIKETGEFICGVFLCVDTAFYEILVVHPRTKAALEDYVLWSERDSRAGRTNLPFSQEVGLVGYNIVIAVNHALAPAPAACTRQEPEVD